MPKACPTPGLSPGELVLHLRQPLGRFLFGKWIEVARTQPVSGAYSVLSRLPSALPDSPWMIHAYRKVMTFLAWRQFAEESGFDALGKSEPGFLPIWRQRNLAAITAVLHGTAAKARTAILMNPSSRKALKVIAGDRANWQPWDAGRK